MELYYLYLHSVPTRTTVLIEAEKRAQATCQARVQELAWPLATPLFNRIKIEDPRFNIRRRWLENRDYSIRY